MNFDLKFADVSIVCNVLSTMSANQEHSDFEFQLQSERLYAEKGAEGSWNKQKTYTDPSDGTVYEWDSEKNGWFPKASIKSFVSKILLKFNLSITCMWILV